MAQKTVELDFDQLTELSREFASRLFRRLPEFRTYARMEPSSNTDHFDLIVEFPSPHGTENRGIRVWMEGGTEPGIGFGKWNAHATEWHTHATVWSPGEDRVSQSENLIDLIEAILADKFVLIYDIGGEFDGSCTAVDLREYDALTEELTSKWSPGQVMMRTWSGRGDREFGLEDSPDE